MVADNEDGEPIAWNRNKYYYQLSKNYRSMKEKKQHYVSPLIEVIQMENEGVIASSASSAPNIPDRPMTRARGSYYGGRNYNSASSSELEDLINDILTIEN